MDFAYAIGEVLCEDSEVALYRGRAQDGHAVLVRARKARRASTAEYELLRREAVAALLAGSEVAATPERIATLGGHPSLVLRDDGATPLSKVAHAPLALATFLPLAVAIGEALVKVHARHLFHGSLHPNDVLVLEDGRVELTGLGHAPPHPRAPARSVASWPYLSPEQTGRLGLAADQRSDLYGLGILFYELLAGRLPFTATDFVGWVHAHAALAPPDLARVAPHVPEAAARIVHKLLSKMPEARYQSAEALLFDLHRLERGYAAGRAAPFPLGEVDEPPRLRRTSRVHGRADEERRLEEAFDRVLRGRHAEVVLVSGPPGIGKTTLLQALRRRVHAHVGAVVGYSSHGGRGRVSGGALVCALDDALHGFLETADETPTALRARFTRALGDSAGLLTLLLPSLGTLIEDVSSPADVPVPDAPRRFAVALDRLRAALVESGRPLVLLLDDVEDNDLASFHVLEHWAAARAAGPLLIVASYRRTAERSDHPLRRARTRLVDAGAPISEIVVEPLDLNAFGAWFADMFHSTRDEVMPLAEVVWRYAEGHPLTTRAFLQTLYRKGALSYAPPAGAWGFDLASAKSEAAAERPVDMLLQETLRTLPRQTRDVLARLALQGTEVGLERAAAGLAVDDEDLLVALGPAFESGVIDRTDDALCFAHRVVAQASASLLSAAEQTEAHLGIARNLVATISPSPTISAVFEIVNHFEKAKGLIESPEEKLRAARYFLAAGARAQRTTDEAAAHAFLHTGLELARSGGGDDGDLASRSLVFELELALLRSEFVIGELAAARSRGEALVTRRIDDGQRAAVQSVLAEVAALDGAVHDAIRHGIEGLEALGWKVPETSGAAETWELMEGAARDVLSMGSRIEDLEVTTEPGAATICDLLSALLAPAVVTSWELVWRISAVGIERSLRYGNARSSGLTFGLLAVWLAREGRYDEAARLGEASYRIALEERSVACRARSSFCWAALLAYLRLPPADCVRLCRRERDAAASVGDITFAGYLERQALHLAMFGGAPLPELLEKATELSSALDHPNVTMVREHVRGLSRCISRLTGATGEKTAGVPIDARRIDALPFRISRFYQYHYELLWRVVAGDVDGAVVAARAVISLIDSVYGFIDAIEARFLVGLAEAAHAWVSGEHEDGLLRLEPHVDGLDALARTMPSTFGARASLLRAERDRLRGRNRPAEAGYARAIELARAAHQLHVEALACERASVAAHARGDHAAADAHRRDAVVAYEEWGAHAKAQEIAIVRREALPPGFERILDAQRAITSTLRLPDLNERILAIAVDEAGARRGCLLHVDGEGVVLAAARGIGAEDFGVLGEPVQDVPLGVCRVARRLQRTIVVDDVKASHRYAQDPFFGAARSGALACLPLVREGRTTALLYLDGAATFADETVARLAYVAAQAAISLESASLYERLERENAERFRAEAELEESRRLLAAVLDGSPSITFVKDLAGRYVMTNRRFEEIFHLERHELVGKSDFELFPRAVADELRRADARVVEEARTIEVDDSVAQDDGVHTYSSVKFPLRDASGRPYALCGIATDVTARRAADEALRRSLSLVEAAMESTADGILVIDLDGRIVRYNRRWAAMWKIPDDILASTDDARALDYVVDQLVDPAGFVEKVRSLYADVGATSRDTLYFHDGRVFERYSQPQRLGGRIVGRVWSFRDVTAEVRAVEERDRVLAEERRARAEAEDAVRVRDQFLSIASHELRTPLTSLGLAVDSLGTLFGPAEKTPQATRALAIASRQIRRVSTLVALLLDVSRIRSGKLVLARADVDLSAIVRDVAALLADERARAASELVVDAPEPVVGCWDGARIEQVIVNLLGNALKFGRGKPIEIRVRREDEGVRLTVRDHGIGMSAEVLPQIFEPFARGVSAKHYGGLGLGLYIAHTIVKAHGGELSATSTEGEGTTFTMVLPPCQQGDG